MNPLQQSTASLDETRRRILFDLLKKRYEEEGISNEAIYQEIEYIVAGIEKGKPLMMLRPQEQLTDANKINDEMREYEIDIYSLFHQLNHTHQRINQHQNLNESILNDMKLKINKVDEKLEEYRQMITHMSANSVYYETFLDMNSIEKNHSLYTDVDQKVVAYDHKARFDVHKNALKLPVINSENKLINFAGVRLANIKITKQLGSGFIRTKNPEHSIDKAIDDSMETFWNETILVDSPLKVNLGRSYYDLKFGATCELTITFDFLSNVNEITITPFTEYPMEVRAILVYTTDNENEVPYELVSPTAHLLNEESTGIISYQFQTVVAKRIKLLLNQKHYIKSDVIMTIDDKSMIDAWLKKQDFIEIDESKIFKNVYLDQAEQNPQWAFLNDFLHKRNIVDEIQKYQKITSPETIQVSKYEYQYGLYNIAIKFNEYHYKGLYVTRPITNTNVHIATLEAIEEHPILNEVDMPITSIEYYLTDKENPTPSDWISIMPQNIEAIYSERLFFQFDGMKYKATTRFPIEKIEGVRKNGHRLKAHVDYESSTQSITIFHHDVHAIYTLDYRPKPESRLINFLELHTKSGFDSNTGRSVKYVSPYTTTEEFKKVTKNGEVILKYYPFIDKEKLNEQPLNWNPNYLSNDYLPIKVRLILPDGVYIDQQLDLYDINGLYLENRTDYFDTRLNLLEPFNGSNYQYRVVENRIQFNTVLPDETRIIVEYPYLTGPIRLKAILRRNLNSIQGLTPFLNEFKLMFQSLK